MERKDDDTASAVVPTFAECAAGASCRGCASVGLEPVVDFGLMPAADAFIADGEADPTAPLALAFCPRCRLAQLLDSLSPDRLFGRRYVYLSSLSASVADAARSNAEALISRYGLTADSLVVEIACNDGYLLRRLANRGIRVIGIEPAPVPAAAARKRGIEVIETFFSTEVGAGLIARGFRPDVVIANNVLAHVPDPSELAAGIALLVGDRGRAIVEVHSLTDLIGNLQFDTIYHEHSSYFSATSVDVIFRRHGLALADVERISLQGGSLRLYFERGTRPSLSVSELLAEEARSGVADGSALHQFAMQTTVRVAELRRAILALAAEGRRIAAYGAAAKGTMLLNHIGLDERTIPFVADRNPHKQGRRVPGVRIPIVALDRLFAARPDFVLLLPWNLRDEILPILEPLRRKGTRVMVPMPDMEIV